MKKELTGHDFAARENAFAARKNAPGRSALASRCVRLGLTAAVGTSLALLSPDVPHAQQRFNEPAVKVTNVTMAGNVVSISADGSLGRAQTWQDPEGFHVVLVNGQAAAGASANGVRTRRVGNSLELVVPVKPGANVTVQPHGNRLDLVVTGGAGGTLRVENFPVEQRPEHAARQESGAVSEQSPETERVRAQVPKVESKRRGSTEAVTSESAQATPLPSATQTQPLSTEQSVQPTQSVPANPSAPADPSVPARAAGVPVEVINPTVAQPASATLGTGQGFDLLSFLFSLPALLVLLGVSMAGAALFVLRRRRGAKLEEDENLGLKDTSEEHADEESKQLFRHFKGDRRKSRIAVPFERRTSGQGAADEASRRELTLGPESKSAARPERVGESKKQAATPQPAVLFGAFRIDQEVAHVVLGEPHSTEVLSSRAPDDRRAVETSLLKALRAPETDEDGRRRARTALEDYGFVARSCAALLLGGESFERVSAARTLGDMKSAQALPFLTEALYDYDPVVRTECVQSLGLLGLPSAIGALLDVARRHQDVPAAVLGPALTACSVESLEVTWGSPVFSSTSNESVEPEAFVGEVRMLVPANNSYEELAEMMEDETLSVALVRIESSDVETRVNAAQQLAQFQVRRAVEALAFSARTDVEPSVRSAAVTSLGLVDHESVFAHVIVALSDEAREVRAAAARALSRLSFDRADAYVRLVETADARTVRDVAHACVKAGLAAQAVGRLTSEDRRQAYEAFSLLSLCVNGGETLPVLDAVECHRDLDVRMTCIQLLSVSNQPEVGEQLRRIAGNGGVPEKVRRSILETVERAVQLQPVEVR
jgi:HEAT repeat protein